MGRFDAIREPDLTIEWAKTRFLFWWPSIRTLKAR